ncbi:uncharacterized protein LOC107030165 [Solanum pennellii]|uniref:Uncharacterized protein LOC107030165 n=1 Tax=Solanum pennellii TaxID=28526 RepID=A0ABM1HL08_SOLPN|nr:uncharacterized protein LOC107030165 [Solanum pennellii]
MAQVDDTLQMINRRFDASDEHTKELRGDLANIGKKLDVHVVSIKHLELQMGQLLRRDEKRRTSRELVDKTTKEVEVPQKVNPIPRHQPPFPQGLGKKTEDKKYRCFITMLKQLSINNPSKEALEQIPDYAKFMMDMVTKKRSVSFEDNDRMQHCSAIATRSLVHKKEDPGALTIPCNIGLLHFAKALCDLGASINFVPLSNSRKLGLGDTKPTAIRLLKVDRTVIRPIRILHDMLMKVDSFIFPSDFMILHCEVNFVVSIILGRPFLTNCRALIDMEKE